MGSSSIRSISGIVYKASHKLSEFVARLLGTREESLSMVVFENGVVTWDKTKNVAIKIAEAEQ